MLNEKTTAIVMADCGITEWTEKSIILTIEEKLEVLNCIKDGTSTPLFEMVKLPFPEFITKYYVTYHEDKLRSIKLNSHTGMKLRYEDFINDSSIGYKIFLLSSANIRALNFYIRGDKKVFKGCHYTNITDILTSSLDDMMRTFVKINAGKLQIRKYVYIMQYVDAKEAERLGLKSFTFCKDFIHRGFALGEKLECLNDLERLAMTKYFGLDGYMPDNMREVEEELGVPDGKLKPFSEKDFLLKFTGALDEFKHEIGFIDREYAPGEIKEYTDVSKYAKMASTLEAYYIQEHIGEITTYLYEKKTLLNSDMIRRLRDAYLGDIRTLIERHLLNSSEKQIKNPTC